MIFALDVAPWEPSDWPKAYATSPYMSTTSWLVFRFLVLLFFVVHYTLHLMEYWGEEHWMYFIYLSRWTITTEVVMEILYFLSAFWGSILVENGIKPDSIPVLVKVHMALMCMLLPASLLSSGLYWALSPYLPPPYVSAACHGGDVIVINLSFFLGRFPFAFNKIGWVGLYGASFAVWTIIHYLLRIGRDDSAPCDYLGYTDLHECPIYKQIDWHHPLMTGILCAVGAVAGPPLLGGLYTGLALLRDRFDTAGKDMRELMVLPEEDAEGRFDLSCKQLNCSTKTPLNCGI